MRLLPPILSYRDPKFTSYDAALQALAGKYAADAAAAQRICTLVGALPLAVHLAGVPPRVLLWGRHPVRVGGRPQALER